MQLFEGRCSAVLFLHAVFLAMDVCTLFLRDYCVVLDLWLFHLESCGACTVTWVSLETSPNLLACEYLCIVNGYAVLLVKRLKEGVGDSSITGAEFDSHALQEIEQQSENEES